MSKSGFSNSVFISYGLDAEPFLTDQWAGNPTDQGLYNLASDTLTAPFLVGLFEVSIFLLALVVAWENQSTPHLYYWETI